MPARIGPRSPSGYWERLGKIGGDVWSCRPRNPILGGNPRTESKTPSGATRSSRITERMGQFVMEKERVADASPDFKAELLARLREAAPEAFAEGKLDIERLKALVGDAVESRPERYEFNWAGKRDAIAMLQAPTRATLVPDRDGSADFDGAQHALIEGENLEVLKVLYRSYFGRVKFIYIDPPYNTGSDFVYPDNFADPLENYLHVTGQKNGNGDYLSSQMERNGRFHSSWLSMMYPRLSLARQFLKDEGIICISIDDNEIHHLRLLMDEIFSPENFVACVIWQKMDSPSRNDEDRYVSNYHDYILIYAKNQQAVGLKKKLKPEILKAYPFKLPDGRLARRRQLRKNGKSARREDRETLWYPLTAPDGTEVWPIAPEGWEGRWVLSDDTWKKREAQKLTQWIKRSYGWVPYYIETAPNEPGVPWPTIWTDIDQNRQAKAEYTELVGSGIEFDSPKPTSLIKQFLRMATGGDDICLDFFAGSGTTAQAVLDLNHEDGSNRRFIVVQLPEKLSDKPSSGPKTIADISRIRISKAIDRIRAGNGDRDPDEAEGPENLGFRSFGLAASSTRRWAGVEERTPEAYGRQLAVFADTLMPGWKPEDVIWEVALREGYSLTAAVAELKAPKGGSFWRVVDAEKDQSFTITLDDTLTLEAVRALGLGKADLFICRDTALDDTLAANLALQCRLKVI
jgi:adenine-specific DNA-methyltransferase